ncbi:hypothetical protein [Rossellomorea aquimaris]|uniref:hypothetical protein n=1 Tax=Rossellomorea aquimaris TaxID=189382 RepID=UPI0011E9286A|nr:hypothetical protein [Rossellomorea aquimaris]TYS86167.1 hypothetical protein FZC88_18720 [Rossellomorea aquimaris]
METKDKVQAETLLNHLFRGSQLDGVQFGISPGPFRLSFFHYKNTDVEDAQLFLNIESKWCLLSSNVKQYPSKEDEIEDLSEEENYLQIIRMRRQVVVKVELVDEHAPHLLIRFENDHSLFINGYHDEFECWQAGVDGVSELVIALPGKDLAIWPPDHLPE